jgi:ATP-dependent Clp protease protease subunit
MATSQNTHGGSAESQTRLNEAHAQNYDAEANLRTAEMRKILAEALEAEAKAATAKIALDREQIKRRKELSADEFYHTYLFDKQVSEDTAKACIKQLAEWERSSKKPLTVELVINSPGGSVFDGFALIDYICGMQARGHTINTIAYGMAASMGGVILQVGNKRSIGSNALLLIHEAQFSAFGSFGKVEDQVKMVELMHDRILALFAARSTMSKAQIKRRWSRRDWWINADDCLKHGFVDAIA